MKIKPTVKGFFIQHYSFWGLAAIALFLAGILSFVLVPGFYALFSFALVGGGVLAFAVPFSHSWLHCRATSISFDEDKLVYETGILDYKKKKIPINQITDSSITRSFVDKFIGSAAFNISTSGSSGYEIVCHGFNHQELESVHNQLYSRIRQASRERQDAPGNALL